MSVEQLIREQYNEFKTKGVLVHRGNGTAISILDNNIIPQQLYRMSCDFTGDSASPDSFLKFNRPVKVLVLGEGVGNLSRLLDTRSVLNNKPLEITAVEKYRAVEEFRVKYKYNNDIKILYTDAVDFINNNSEEYDYAFVDVFEITDMVDIEIIDLVFSRLINFCGKVIVNILNSGQKHDILAKYNNFAVDSGFDIVNNLVAYKKNENAIFHIYNRTDFVQDKPLVKNHRGEILFRLAEGAHVKITMDSFCSV